MTNLLSNVITSSLWTLAVIHVLTDRVVRPFVSALLVELLPLPADEPLLLATVTPTVSITPAPEPTPVTTAVIPRRKRGRPRKHAVAIGS
jgi:hypothetical protein